MPVLCVESCLSLCVVSVCYVLDLKSGSGPARRLPIYPFHPLASWLLLMISKSSTFKGMGRRSRKKKKAHACVSVLRKKAYQTGSCCDRWGRPWLGPVRELVVASTLARSSVCLHFCALVGPCPGINGSLWNRVLANRIHWAARVFTVDQPLPSIHSYQPELASHSPLKLATNASHVMWDTIK